MHRRSTVLGLEEARSSCAQMFSQQMGLMMVETVIAGMERRDLACQRHHSMLDVELTS